jgi:sarcosine oxidase subunit beta
VLGVRTPRGDISAPVVVNAAGPYAGEIGKMAGVDVPVQPYRRQLFFTQPFPQIPDPIPIVIDFHRGWYFRREGAGLLISGPKDNAPSFDLSVNYDCLEGVAYRSVHRVPVLEWAEVNGGWAGTYEISPDNHAIIGEASDLAGFFVAGGFSGHGFQHSPAAGKVLAELILGEQTSIDISSLALERFSKGELIPEFLTAFNE